MEKMVSDVQQVNYNELKQAVIRALDLGEAFGDIFFEKILKEMPQDHSYEVYGFTKGKYENFTPSDQQLEEE